MTLKYEPNNLSNASKLINYYKDNTFDYLCLVNKDHNNPNKSSLITDNSLSSRNIYSNSEYILLINEYTDLKYLSKHHRKQNDFNKICKFQQHRLYHQKGNIFLDSQK